MNLLSDLYMWVNHKHPLLKLQTRGAIYVRVYSSRNILVGASFRTINIVSESFRFVHVQSGGLDSVPLWLYRWFSLGVVTKLKIGLIVYNCLLYSTPRWGRDHITLKLEILLSVVTIIRTIVVLKLDAVCCSLFQTARQYRYIAMVFKDIGNSTSISSVVIWLIVNCLDRK